MMMQSDAASSEPRAPSLTDASNSTVLAPWLRDWCSKAIVCWQHQLHAMQHIQHQQPCLSSAATSAAMLTLAEWQGNNEALGVQAAAWPEQCPPALLRIALLHKSSPPFTPFMRPSCGAAANLASNAPFTDIWPVPVAAGHATPLLSRQYRPEARSRCGLKLLAAILLANPG